MSKLDLICSPFFVFTYKRIFHLFWLSTGTHTHVEKLLIMSFESCFLSLNSCDEYKFERRQKIHIFAAQIKLLFEKKNVLNLYI